MKIKVSLSPSMFNKDNPKNIENCINAAETAATECLAHSHFIISQHEAGRTNTSRASTRDGVLRSAEVLTGVIGKESESEDEVFFGENIGDAIQTFKSLFKKK